MRAMRLLCRCYNTLNASYCTRRYLSTGLASAFNVLHKNTGSKAGLFVKKTGLFANDNLQSPEGFNLLRDRALLNANRIVDEVVDPTRSQNHNVVEKFDELSNCLCKVADLAEFIRVGHPHPRFRAAAEQASVAISTLVEKLNTNRALYDTLKTSNFANDLDEYVAKLFMFDFEQSGIHLDEDKRRLVLQLNEEILKLGSIFAANSDQARLVKNPQLIPESIRHVFANSIGRTYASGLHADSSNELLREFGYRLYLSPDETQDEILTSLLSYRLKLARLCGFESYAHRAVKGGIAGTPEVVQEFIDILSDRIKVLADKDYAQILELKLAETGSTSRGGQQLQAWDIPYYSANYKRSIHNENVVQCLPYFSIGVCMDGLNMIFNELYGVRMQVEQCQADELWHASVIKLSIIDEQSNDRLGYIYCDLFERQSKQQQDCHHTIQGGCYLRDGSYQLPIVVLVLSLPHSSECSPSLLSPSMVDNLFHEMGHAMHSMLARTKYQHITGTRCSTDLAEVPSILMEFFGSDPRVVSRFARHHATGESLPGHLLKSWINSKRIFIASETQLQIFYAALDQAYHGASVDSLAKGKTSTTEMLAKIQSQYYSIGYVENTAWQLRFSHLVGYGAKYYSYLVSRAVATAIWMKLFAEDPLSRKAGLHYKHEVLSHGGGKAADKIVEDTLNCRVDAKFIADNVIRSFNQPKVE